MSFMLDQNIECSSSTFFETAMKIILQFVLAALLLGCNPSSGSRETYYISKISQEKDGKTLYLKDQNNNDFTTVISIPNGNYIEVNEGDTISVEIESIIETYPRIIISKNIKVLK